MALASGFFRRKFGKIFLGIVGTVCFGWILFLVVQHFFSIKVIEVVGDNIEVILNEDRISKNLLFFPSQAIRSKVLSDNPWLVDVKFVKKFPNTLQIVPVLRSPIAKLQSNERLVLMDKSGMILGDADSSVTLPIIQISAENLRVGGIVDDKRVQMALVFIEGVEPSLLIDHIESHDRSYLLAKSSKSNIFIPQDRSISQTIATLQTLITGFRIKGTLPTVVDLRFDKPIIKF